MNGEPTKGIEDIVRRNVAALRSKANLTQQALADEMLRRGIAWTRETVAQVETTNRRLGFTEALVVAACLDVPVARLTATSSPTVAVGDSEWTAAYLGAAIAGTAGDIFSPESYSARRPRGSGRGRRQATERPRPHRPPPRLRTGDGKIDACPTSTRPSNWEGDRPIDPTQGPQKTAERIERRLRLRVTAGDVDAAAQNLWSRSLESERERRVTDRHAVTGGSLQTIRGHVSRDLDREIAYEMERNPRPGDAAVERGELSPEEATWEATRLNILLANKGYSDSDVTRWWNFTRHRRARRPDHRRGLECRRLRRSQPAGRVPPRQARIRRWVPDRRVAGIDRRPLV